MPEPSVSEILNVNADPERGTGEPAVVYDNSQVLNLLNQNARANQENQWRRYTRFLDDYQNRLKTRQDIAELNVADSDREYLKQQATDLFKTALDNPTAIYSPEFNNKLGQIKSDATSSKLARDFAEKNLQWMAIHPELNTEENKAKVLDYIDGQTVEGGGRATFTLDLPDIFDTQKYFGELRKDPRVIEMINANRVDPKQELIYQRQDKKYKYKPFLELVKMGYDSTPQIRTKAEKDFNALPPEVKRNFEDAKDYWVNFGSKHFGSPGFDDIIEQGEEIIKPYNAPGEKAERAFKWAKLNEDARQANMDDATKRYIAQLNDNDKGSKAVLPELPVSPLPAIFGTIGKENTLFSVKDLPISQIAAINPAWIKKDSNGKLTEQITSDAEDLKISVGKNKDGNYGVYVFDEKGKRAEEFEGKIINEDRLKSNAESWLATYAKERKGQDVYATLRPLFEQFKLKDAAANVTIEEQSLPIVSSQAEYDKLKSGQVYIENGFKYKKP